MRREQIRARVTKAHIDEARRELFAFPSPSRSTSCPVARSLSEKDGTPWSVGISSAGPLGERLHEIWEPGPKTMSFIHRFDKGDSVEPFTAVFTRLL